MSTLISVNNPILRIKAVKELIGVGFSTIHYHVSIGLYPKPIKLGEKMSGWLTSEVLAIQAARVAGQTNEQIKALVQRLENERTQAAA
ncbi:helix-turn-helix transcriptional regulator [Hydromonas duriensis]|uniref:AlpA family transcriptional regulator n=1 Tax=Hydromonas duriensis TaxID=1527608 RepID=A0A4R6Y4L5_9BURK|nr:AlpA family phage regulatory protein [Hydromonas duriensis]TDR27862.1 AlpA family transcriptional regulator [Hydromonas duriensis]